MSTNPNETTEHIVSNMINWSDKFIKSQHELNTCNDGKRSSDVVLSAVEKCERLQKQLEIAVRALRGVRVWANTGNGGEQAVKKLCDETLKKIEELKNES